MRARHVRATILIGTAIPTLAIAAGTGAQSTPTAGFGGWRIAGRDLNNSRSQPSEQQICAANVGHLVAK